MGGKGASRIRSSGIVADQCRLATAAPKVDLPEFTSTAGVWHPLRPAKPVEGF